MSFKDLIQKDLAYDGLVHSRGSKADKKGGLLLKMFRLVMVVEITKPKSDMFSSFGCTPNVDSNCLSCLLSSLGFTPSVDSLASSCVDKS
jgi:hypothetical protein